MNSFNAQELRDARWLYMLNLYHGKDVGVSEGMFRKSTRDMKYALSYVEIRNAIFYLEELGFCRVEKLPDHTFRAYVTAKGQDLCNYDIDSPSSIARPETKYWV